MMRTSLGEAVSDESVNGDYSGRSLAVYVPLVEHREREREITFMFLHHIYLNKNTAYFYNFLSCLFQ